MDCRRHKPRPINDLDGRLRLGGGRIRRDPLGELIRKAIVIASFE
jgi:hypothetical protein